MFKTMMTTTFAIFAISLSASALAKDTAPAADNTNLPSELTFNIAKTAIAMGVKQPLTINKDGNNAKISGSNSTICTAKLSADAEPKMLGISCKQFIFIK